MKQEEGKILILDFDKLIMCLKISRVATKKTDFIALKIVEMEILKKRIIIKSDRMHPEQYVEGNLQIKMYIQLRGKAENQIYVIFKREKITRKGTANQIPKAGKMKKKKKQKSMSQKTNI